MRSQPSRRRARMPVPNRLLPRSVPRRLGETPAGPWGSRGHLLVVERLAKLCPPASLVRRLGPQTRSSNRPEGELVWLPFGDAPVFPDQGHSPLLALVQTEGIEES